MEAEHVAFTHQDTLGRSIILQKRLLHEFLLLLLPLGLTLMTDVHIVELHHLLSGLCVKGCSTGEDSLGPLPHLPPFTLKPSHPLLTPLCSHSCRSKTKMKYNVTSVPQNGLKRSMLKMATG